MENQSAQTFCPFTANVCTPGSKKQTITSRKCVDTYPNDQTSLAEVNFSSSMDSGADHLRHMDDVTGVERARQYHSSDTFASFVVAVAVAVALRLWVVVVGFD